MRITNLFWTVVLLAPLSVFAQQHKEICLQLMHRYVPVVNTAMEY